MEVYQILKRLTETKVKIQLENGNLKISLPDDFSNKGLLDEIKNKKSELIEYVQIAKRQSGYVDIEPLEEQDYYNLSFGQRRIWLQHQSDLKMIAYNQPRLFYFNEQLDIKKLNYAFAQIVEKNEILRTIFPIVSGEPKQKVVDSNDFHFNIEQIDATFNYQEKIIETALENESKIIFDLEGGPLFRVKLILLTGKKSVVLLNTHHIICDKWSIDFLQKEMVNYYHLEGDKFKKPVSEPPIQYKDYVSWEKKQLSDIWRKTHLSFWKKKLSLPIERLNLPYDIERTETRSFNGQVVQYQFSDKESDLVKLLAKEHKVNTYVTLLAILQVYLFKLTGQRDILLGTIASGRDHHAFESQIGFYVNTFVMRSRINDNNDFASFIQQVKEDTFESLNHQQFPFDLLIEELGITRGQNKNLLFDILVTYENRNTERIYRTGERSRLIEGISTSRFDLLFTFVKYKNSELDMLIEYNSDIFFRNTIDRLFSGVKQMIQIISTNHSTLLKELPVVLISEQIKLNEFQGTDGDPESIKNSIIDLFEYQTQKYPDKLALVHYDKSFTYQELNQRANNLARYLLEQKEIDDEDIIAVVMERGDLMIISLLAILKTRAAFLPIDPSLPDNRIEHILADAVPKTIITDDEDFLKRPINQSHQPLFLSQAFEVSIQSAINHFDNLKEKPQINHLAYIMYTSGSTGHPKGVMINHKSVVRLVCNTNYIELNNEDHLLQTGALSFDASTFEIWGMLLNGGTLHFLSSADLLDNQMLVRKSLNDHINVMWLTSSLFNQLIDEGCDTFKGLKYLVAGGEKLSSKHVKHLKKHYPDINLINGYGPTENTTFSMCHSISLDDPENIPLGKPVRYSQAYVLNQNKEVVPIGAIGEIYLGGEGLSRGYLNQPELTHSRFITVTGQFNNNKIYQTGDFGRWNEQGLMEFKGRKDSQVKIRGFRTELGEIESQIKTVKEVENAVVRAVKHDGIHQYLIAYFISSSKKSPISKIVNHLKRNLPFYMIPSHFLLVDSFPLSINGKLDLSKLPLPEIGANLNKEESLNLKEEELYKIWLELLGVKQFSKHQSFFELGGDSIKAIQVSSRLYKVGYKLATKDIIVHQTIEKLAPLMKELKENNQEIVEGEVPLTPIQNEFFHSLGKEDLFHQSVLVYSEEGYKYENLIKIFNKILEHHDALRIFFQKSGNHFTQINQKDNLEIELKKYDCRDQRNDRKIILDGINEIHNSLNILKPPLIKLALFITTAGDYLLIAIHHLVVDGVSMRILLEDFKQLLDQTKNNSDLILPPKTTSFKDWSISLSLYSKSDKLIKEKDYWKSIANCTTQPIRTGEKNQNIDEIALHSFTLDKEHTERLLKNVHKVYNTEITDILISVITNVLCDEFDYDRISILMEGHGREEFESDIDVSRTIGWFTTTFPVIVNRQEDIFQQVIEVKETFRKIPNKGIGYGILKYITENKGRQGLNFNLVPQMAFNYLGQFDTQISNSDLKITNDGLENNNTSMFREIPLHIQGIILNKKLSLSFKFQKRDISSSSMKRSLKKTKEKLIYLIDRLNEKDETILTPSDLTYKNLSFSDLSLINRTNKIKDVFPLTPMQSGMVFHSLKEPESKVYFIQKTFRLKGKLDISLLEESLFQLFKRHEILQSKLDYKTSYEPFLVICPDQRLKINFEDLTNRSSSSQNEYLNIEREKDKNTPFELDGEVLMRLSVYQITETKFECIWSFHHILMDGWSIGVFMSELSYIYSELSNKNKLHFKNNNTFKNHIDWLMNQDKEKAEAHWDNYLLNCEPSFFIPKKTRIQIKEKKFNKIRVLFNEDKTKEIKGLATQNGVTLNNLVKTVWGILLAYYGNKTDVVFGEVVSGRPSELEGVETLIGLFINTNPVRIKFDFSETFSRLLKNVQIESLDNELYQHQPLSEIQSSLGMTQLFDHILIFENYPSARNIAGLTKSNGNTQHNLKFASSMDLPSFEQTNYDLNIAVYPLEELSISFTYNQLVYEDEIIEEVMDYMINIFNNVLANKDIQIGNTICKDPKYQIEALSGNTLVSEETLQNSILCTFRRQVETNPDSIALCYLNNHITYFELDRLSNVFANYLVKYHNVFRDTIVGVMIDRSEEMIISILAVLKAGGAYLPIDPNYPEERKKHIISDSGVQLILTNSAYIFDFDSYKGQLFAIDLQFDTLPDESTSPAISIDANQLAYVVYTSGSTGQSKGVLVEHGSLENFILDQVDRFNLSKNDYVFQFVSISFDASVLEIFSALASSATLVLTSQLIINNLDFFHQYIDQMQVTVLIMPPSFLINLNNQKLNNVRLVITGAEEPILSDALELSRSSRYFNSYGPAECTVCSSVYELKCEDTGMSRVPIGNSISNTWVYLLNKQGKPVPRGAKGEIFIAGKNLARGYLNNPELSAKRFIENTFRPSEKMYATGDFGEWNTNNTLEFIGREDDQIKVRGIRVELGEIENQLLKYEGITNAAVKLFELNNDVTLKTLVAYYTATQAYAQKDLRVFLSENLPDYMIPNRFILLSELPISINGKIDKSALPIPDKNQEKEGVSDQKLTSKEKMLIEIYRDVLGKDGITVNDNFFEAGGDSIKAIQISSRLYQKGFHIEIGDVFNYQTIEELAPYVGEVIDEIDQKPVVGSFSYSPIEAEFFEMDLAEPNHFNLSMLFYCDQLSLEDAHSIFSQMATHHDILRVRFNAEEKNQINHDTSFPLSIEEYDLAIDPDFITKFAKITKKLQESLNIYEGPLWRIGLFHLRNEQCRVLFVIHHMLVDVVSWNILIEDMNTLLKQRRKQEIFELPQKTDSYKKWISGLNEYAKSNELISEMSYWKKVHSSHHKLIQRDQKNVKETGITDSSFTLSTKYTEQLITKVNKAFNTEINDILLTALGVAVKKQFDISSFLLTMESHGREHPLSVNISRTVGWFTCTFPFLIEIMDENNLDESIISVKEGFRKVPNRGLGYGVLKHLTPKELKNEMCFNVIPLLSFNYLGQVSSPPKESYTLNESNLIKGPTGFIVSNEPIGPASSPLNRKLYELEVIGMVVSGQLKLSIQYEKDHYQQSTMDQFMNEYKQTLISIIDYCLNKDKSVSTPSDFTYKELSIEEMDKLLN